MLSLFCPSCECFLGVVGCLTVKRQLLFWLLASMKPTATCWDGEYEQTAEPSSSQKSALTEAPTVGQHEQDERASRNFNQPKYKLGEVEVRPQPGHT